MEEVTIDEFQKFDIRTAKVVSVEDIPNSDKLYKIMLEVGDKTKQIVAGIKPNHSKEELEGRTIIIIDNLKPATLRGVESQGMLLAADSEEGPLVLVPEREVESGIKIK